jgi:hypothetical protein
MRVQRISAAILVAFLTATAGKNGKKEEITVSGPGVLWREPAGLASRDLYFGAGGKERQPKAPFRFEKEDLDGSSPKFTVVDGAGVKWKVKLGQEARSETAASRLTWAVGYFVPEDYLVKDLTVEEIPLILKRGQNLRDKDGTMHNARFKREEKKLGDWKWDDPALAGRELDGLKALMALLNNWDLKDENNSAYEKKGERILMVTDLGASFGSGNRSYPQIKAKDNLAEYSKSRFIVKRSGDTVDFYNPGRPRFVYVVVPSEYRMRLRLEALGRNIPREHVVWIAKLLSGLSTEQIRDAFRAAGYSPDEVEQFARTVEARITQLTDL